MTFIAGSACPASGTVQKRLNPHVGENDGEVAVPPPWPSLSAVGSGSRPYLRGSETLYVACLGRVRPRGGPQIGSNRNALDMPLMLAPTGNMMSQLFRLEAKTPECRIRTHANFLDSGDTTLAPPVPWHHARLATAPRPRLSSKNQCIEPPNQRITSKSLSPVGRDLML